MLIRIFRANNLGLGFGLLVVASALWLPAVLNGREIAFSGVPMPLYSFFLSVFSPSGILPSFFSVLLIIGEGLLLNFIVQKSHLLRSQTFLPALTYVVLMSSLPDIMLFHPVLFANLFILFSIRRIFDLLGNANSSSVAFDSAFFISVASLFYFPCVLFLIFIWISLVSLRAFSLRDWMIAGLGFLIPYLFAGVYYFWIGETAGFWSETVLQPVFNKIQNEVIFLKSLIAFLVFLSLLVMISIPSFLSEMGRNKAAIRISLRLFIVMGFFAVLSYFLSSSNSLFHFCLAAVPLSIIFSNTFLNVKPVFSEILFSLFILLIVIYQLNYF